VNDGFTPENSIDHTHGVYALSYERSSGGEGPWLQYVRSEPVAINRVEIYWAVDPPRPGALPGSSDLRRMAVPENYRILYWNGIAFVPVREPKGIGVARDTFNATTFEVVKTDKLRIEIVTQKDQPAGILEWRVYNSGEVPSLPPVIEAGVDRSVILDGRTYLAGKVTWIEDSRENVARWSKTSGPGIVTFDNA
jgi:hypothetical protein